MTTWDPAQYEKFIKDRTQPAADLADRLAALCPMNILDLGCGPGNSTRVLIDRFPCARVIGADNSREMLARAKEALPDTGFVYLDAGGDLSGIGEKFDIVFSNACLQWLPDHARLLPRLVSLLRPGGTFAVQIPMQSEHPVHIILSRLTASDKWKGRFAPRRHNVLTTEQYFDVLSGISDRFEIWETVYCHRMPDIDSIIEWYRGTGLRPYLEQLTEDDTRKFTGDIQSELKKEYGTRANGEILFRFPRLFFTVSID